MESAGTQYLASLAAEAFIYGFPMVFDLQQLERFTHTGMGSVPAAPFNVFAHAPGLAGPKETFVSINNDTAYSIATSTSAAGRSRSRCRTPWPLLRASRWAVNGEADMPAVRELQRALTLTPTAAGRGLPDIDPSVPEDRPGEDGDGAAARRRSRTERMATDLSRVRLQPGLLRAWRARRRSVEAPRRTRALPEAHALGPGGSLRQPRLRGRVRDGVRRRRRQRARRFTQLRAALRERVAVPGVLVGDDVRPA